jgi:hypothetical protein
MEPGLLAGDVRCPLYLLVEGDGNSLRPWPGAAQAGGQAGGAVAAAATDRGGDRALEPSPHVFS